MPTSLETVHVQNVGKARYATRNGRKYLVAPMTILVPGVLNGSQGPLYYPPDEVSRNYKGWDGMPLVSYHPTSTNGSQLSANDDSVLEKQGLGEFRGSVITKDGKLRGEGWFDLDKTKNVNNRIVTALQSGQPIELSTGLYTDNQPAPAGAHYQGKSYTHIARNYRPDHVAILIDQVGACAIRDGCGVFNRQASRDRPQAINADPDSVNVGDQVRFKNDEHPYSIVDLGHFSEIKKKYPEEAEHFLAHGLPPHVAEESLGRTWVARSVNGLHTLLGSSGVRNLVEKVPTHNHSCSGACKRRGDPKYSARNKSGRKVAVSNRDDYYDPNLTDFSLDNNSVAAIIHRHAIAASEMANLAGTANSHRLAAAAHKMAAEAAREAGWDDTSNAQNWLGYYTNLVNEHISKTTEAMLRSDYYGQTEPEGGGYERPDITAKLMPSRSVLARPNDLQAPLPLQAAASALPWTRNTDPATTARKQTSEAAKNATYHANAAMKASDKATNATLGSTASRHNFGDRSKESKRALASSREAAKAADLVKAAVLHERAAKDHDEAARIHKSLATAYAGDNIGHPPHMREYFSRKHSAHIEAAYQHEQAAIHHHKAAASTVHNRFAQQGAAFVHNGVEDSLALYLAKKALDVPSASSDALKKSRAAYIASGIASQAALNGVHNPTNHVAAAEAHEAAQDAHGEAHIANYHKMAASIHRALAAKKSWITPEEYYPEPKGRVVKGASSGSQGQAQASNSYVPLVANSTLTRRQRILGIMARRELESTGRNPASWVKDEGKWEKAKRAVGDRYGGKDSSRYWAAVTHIYENMGGKIKGKRGTHNVNPQTSRSGAEPSRSGAEPSRSGAEPSRSGAEPSRSGAEPATRVVAAIGQKMMPILRKHLPANAYHKAYGAHFAGTYASSVAMKPPEEADSHLEAVRENNEAHNTFRAMAQDHPHLATGLNALATAHKYVAAYHLPLARGVQNAFQANPTAATTLLAFRAGALSQLSNNPKSANASAAAYRATKAADASDRPEDHEAASSLHRAAYQAHGGGQEIGTAAFYHKRAAIAHDRAATQLRGPSRSRAQTSRSGALPIAQSA